MAIGEPFLAKSRIDMSVLQKAIDIVNKRMNRTAKQIEAELRQAGYRYYPKSTNVVPSFKIMGEGESSYVSGSFGTGGHLIKSVRIGSKLLEAYYAVYGNGSRIIYPRTAKALHYKDGTYHAYSHPYEGHNFVVEVANRHR